MKTIFLSIDPNAQVTLFKTTAYQELILTTFSAFQQISIVLISIAILMQIISIIFALRKGDSRAGERALDHLYKAIIYIFFVTFYTSWIVPYTKFAILIEEVYTPIDDGYRKNFLDNTFKKLNGEVNADSLLRASGLKDWEIAAGKKVDIIRNFQISKAKTNALNKQLTGGGGSDGDPWYDVITSQAIGGIGAIAAYTVMPLVRDISIVLINIMTLLVTAFFPLAFVYSSIPRMEDTVIPIFMLIIGIRLWGVILWGLDQLQFIFDEAYKLKFDGDANFRLIYPWVFIGLYIFIPKVLEVFWPSRASSLTTAVSVGVTYLMNAAKTALTKGMSSLSGSM
ncbi:MAG: hypothetical protein IM631_13155 [Cytophagales bacterium]|nr:hypothetical protein [Cytophagales bacterium]MCA6372321.1 hypothetical protein [Cytophagales bacterium]MCA6382467.1 hypothetical protein [Cytophagales bacterium]